jgi:hypothetical protein
MRYIRLILGVFAIVHTAVFGLEFNKKCEHGTAMSSRFKEIGRTSLDSSIAYIQFGKVGSTSVRHFLWNTTRFHKAFRSRDIHKGGNIIYDMQIKDHEELRNSYQGGFGTCEYLLPDKNSLCQYFAFIRHPIDRAVSGYNYFCLKCGEDGRFCNGTKKNAPPCPHATIMQWTKYEGNAYVNDFSLYHACMAHKARINPAEFFAERSRFVSPQDAFDVLDSASTSVALRQRTKTAISNALRAKCIIVPTDRANFTQLLYILNLTAKPRRVIPSIYKSNSGIKSYLTNGSELLKKMAIFLFPDITFYNFFEDQWLKKWENFHLA